MTYIGQRGEARGEMDVWDNVVTLTDYFTIFTFLM